MDSNTTDCEDYTPHAFLMKTHFFYAFVTHLTGTMAIITQIKR